MKNILSILLCLFVLSSFQSVSATTNDAYTTPEHFSSSPEQTWDQFKAALFSGNFYAARQYCSASNARGVNRFEKMNGEKRKDIVESMQDITKVHLQGDKAKYKLIRNSNGFNLTTYVYFEKISNEWKIENY
jgi:hypothetical protein